MALSRSSLASSFSSAQGAASTRRRGPPPCRIQCCAAAKNNLVGESSISSSSSSSSSSRIVFPSTIVFPSIQQLDADEDEDAITLVDYNDKPSKCSWLTPEYLDMRLRCSSLLMNEASAALNRHFNKERKSVASKQVTSRPRYEVLRLKELSHRQQKQVQDPVARPMTTMDLIRVCILSDILHEYFEETAISHPFLRPPSSTTLEEAAVF